MKKINIYTILIIALGIVSCQEVDKLMYDDFAGIHIKIPKDNQTFILREDTLVYSFAFESPDMKQKTVYIPVEIEGFRSDKDRKFKVKLIEAGTTAKAGVNYEPLKDYYTVKANSGKDSIPINIIRTLDIREKSKSIALELVATEDFKIGIKDKQQVYISVSDILEEPEWWKGWKFFLGEYHRIKYQEWMRIKGGKGELPMVEGRSPFQIYFGYPTELVLIMELRLYFEKNPRYTKEDLGDPNDKGERITIPNPF